MGRPVVISAGSLGFLGVLFAVEHFIDTDHYNPGFYEYPMIIGLHVAPGGVFLAFALLQLTPRLRSAYPAVHRIVGRLTVAAGLVSAVTAVFAIVLFPFSGPGMVFFVAPFAVYLGVALVRGFVFARKRNFVEHGKWMTRAFAIASAIATQRLILLPTLALFGTDDATIRWASMFAFTSAFVVHSIAAELWIRMGQREAAGSKLHEWAPQS